MPRLLGTVYLLHFAERYKGEEIVTERDGTERPRKEWPGAQHYIGWTPDLADRLQAHARGDGARLVAVMVGKGIPFELARVWENVGRKEERRLKNQGGASRLCPLCKGAA